MAKVSQLPTEIWLNIVRYLPKSQLVHLKYLNTVFLYTAMDIDWGQIAIDTKNSDQAALILSRMADPFVASRTTRLTVYLREWRTLLRPSKLKLPSIIRYMPVVQTPEPTTQATLMTLLLNVLPIIHNLTFLRIDILHISLDLIQDLFRTIKTSSFARTIEKLSLTGHPDLFSSLVECPNPETIFPNLSALDFQLIDRNNEDYPDSTFNTDNSLAHFILSLPCLQQLSILSLFDISPLFTLLSQPLHNSSSLIPLPNLKSVALIPFNFTFRSSPQAVHRFLIVHSANIQHLQFNLMNSQWPTWDMDEVLDKWLSNFVNASKKPSLFFPNLQSLDIHPPETPAGLSAVLVFIKRTVSTLTSLRIRCKLTVKGATQVVTALTKSKVKLKSLQLDMSNIDVPFIELLAVKLPQLEQLRLWWENGTNSRLSRELFVMILENRRYDVSAEDDCLTSWKLRYLSIQGFGGDSIDVAGALAPFLPCVVLTGDDDESDDE